MTREMRKIYQDTTRWLYALLKSKKVPYPQIFLSGTSEMMPVAYREYRYIHPNEMRLL